jgi:RecJ-like exonuclease
MGDDEGFYRRCAEAREAIARMNEPLIVNHFDCDGLSSGSLAALGLQKMGKKYRMKTVRKADAALFEEIKGEREIIFVDIAGASPEVDELQGTCVVLDHHQTKGGNALQANPHLFGIDGGSEISAAGVAYCVFQTAADLAIVGAVGDIQYPLIGLNRKNLEEGERAGEVLHKTDLKLYGRMTRPLANMLQYADEPLLPGLTGNEEACSHFISRVKIEQKRGETWTTYEMLSEDEKKKFTSALIEHMSENGMGNAAEELVGEVYLLPLRPKLSELSDAQEFSTLLNACGRNRNPELGVKICMGDEGALVQGRALLAEHRRNLRAGLDFAMRNWIDLGKFVFVDGRGIIDDGIIGVVAGMVYAPRRGKPIVAVAVDEEGKIKISTRATKAQVAAGLNLGAALRSSAGAVGGVGGGHNIAAGASIPSGKLDEFLREFAKSV